MNKSIALYIHIPFCKAKCYYCDFNSYSNKENLIKNYLLALEKEISLYFNKLSDYTIGSIYIGGGTPSYIEPNYLADVIKLCKKGFNISKAAEISIESNPGTLSVIKLDTYKSIGINRLSIGLQAYQDEVLKQLGRIHDFNTFEENYKLAKSSGFNNINVDLMFGIPNQTFGQWKETLEKVINLEPEHISCYSLKIEENTVFGEQFKKSIIEPIDDCLDREMYHYAIEVLEENSYNHYEISNFSKRGYECMQNLVYWTTQSYIGLGAGAHSYFNGQRFNNVYDLNKYINLLVDDNDVIEEAYDVDKAMQISEYIIMGLRLTKGISINEFNNKFNENFFDLYGSKVGSLVNKSLLEVKSDNIRLSKLGLDLANIVFMEFI